jgi:fumarate hydratase class II
MLAAGGTAVGTGLNTRVGFAEKVAAKVGMKYCISVGASGSISSVGMVFQQATRRKDALVGWEKVK